MRWEFASIFIKFLSQMEPSLPVQTLEFEDYKNDTQYEEYEEYEDHFEFAERDRAQTWDGEVTPALRSECY